MERQGIRYAVRERVDQALIVEFFYECVWQDPGLPPLPRDVVDLPELTKYWQGFGRPGDLAVAAEDAGTGETVGLAWLRLWRTGATGYGFLAPDVPELSMAVRAAFRGRGIGRELLACLEVAARERGVRAISLSVQHTNPAARLYRRGGYAVREHRDEDLVMCKTLRVDG